MLPICLNVKQEVGFTAVALNIGGGKKLFTPHDLGVFHFHAVD